MRSETMHTETIQVQYVNPPNPGGKKGSIKTTGNDAKLATASGKGDSTIRSAFLQTISKTA
jgi:hypothetical protein